MRKSELLKILKEGTATWNDWRSAHAHEHINLRKVDLSGASLQGANLQGIDFSQATLSEADLSNVNLKFALLQRAYMRGTNLSGADLGGANLTDADLSKANLTGARLRGCTLDGTDLTDSLLLLTDFTQAQVQSLRLNNVNLRETQGLETVIHVGPSTVGIDTLFKSEGAIPQVFLRGAGVPESFIQYIPSLTERPIQFYSCFISYSHEDKTFARALHDVLQGRGVRCWLDEHQLLPGDDIYVQVDRGIRLWDKVLLCCSRYSLTSWWVMNEIDTALSKEIRLRQERGREALALIPLNLDGYLFSGSYQSGQAPLLKSRFAADFSGWEKDRAKFENQVERLLKALQVRSGDERIASRL